MPDKPNKGAKPQTDSVRIQLDKLRLQNARLKAANDIQDAEIKLARRKLKEYKDEVETRLINETKLDIQSVLKCSDLELTKLTAGKTLDQLEAMLENMLLVKGDKAKPFTSIRAGGDASKTADDMFTMPDLFGKTAKQVREIEVA